MLKQLSEYIKTLRKILISQVEKPSTPYEELRYMVALLLKYGFVSVGCILLLIFFYLLFTPSEADLPLIHIFIFRILSFELSEGVSALFGLMLLEYMLVRVPHPFLSREERRLLQARHARPSVLEAIQDGLVILSFAGAAFLTFHIPFFVYHYGDEIRYKFIAYASVGIISAVFAAKAIVFGIKRHIHSLYRLKVLYFGGAAMIALGALMQGYQIQSGKTFVISGIWLIAIGFVIGVFHRSGRFRHPATRPLQWLYRGLGIMPVIFASALTALLLGFSEMGYILLGGAFLLMTIFWLGAGYDFYYHLYLPKVRHKLALENAHKRLSEAEESEDFEDFVDASEEVFRWEPEDTFREVSLFVERRMYFIYFFTYFVWVAALGLLGGLMLLGIPSHDFFDKQLSSTTNPIGYYAFGIYKALILLLICVQMGYAMFEKFPSSGIYRDEKVWLHFEVLPQGLPASKTYLWIRDTLYLLSIMLAVVFLLNGGQPLFKAGFLEVFLGTQVLLLYGAILRMVETPEIRKEQSVQKPAA